MPTHVQTRKLSAAGWTLPPIVVPNGGGGYPLLIASEISSGASLTYSIYMLKDRIRSRKQMRAANITRSTTTATVVLKTGAQPKVGDLIFVDGAGAPFDGWAVVASVTNTTTFTYTVANSGLSVSEPGSYVQLFRPLAIAAGLSGQTGDAAASLPGPAAAVALNVSAYTSGSVELSVTDAG